MNRSTNTNAVLLLLLCAVFWGACFPVGKHALGEVHALTLMIWRFTIASICLMVYAKCKQIAMPTLTPKQWAYAIGISIIGVSGFNLGVFTGLAHTNASNGALIMALSPLTTSLISSLLQLKLPTLGTLFSLAVCLYGVLIVLTNGELKRLLGFEFNQGDQLIFLGMLCWSVYTYLTQSISRWMPIIPFTLVGMVSGVGVISLVSLVSGGVHPLQESLAISQAVLADLLFIGIFGTVGGYLLWISGVKQLGATNASLFFNFVPVFAVLTAFFYGQEVTELQLIGITIVITGLLIPRIVQWCQRRFANDQKVNPMV